MKEVCYVDLHLCCCDLWNSYSPPLVISQMTYSRIPNGGVLECKGGIIDCSCGDKSDIQ